MRLEKIKEKDKKQVERRLKKIRRKLFAVYKSDEKEYLVLVSEIAKTSTYSREYLGYSIRRKKLEAQKIDGLWYTTEKWLFEFTDKSKKRKDEFRKNLSEKLTAPKARQGIFLKPGFEWAPDFLRYDWTLVQ